VRVECLFLYPFAQKRRGRNAGGSRAARPGEASHHPGRNLKEAKRSQRRLSKGPRWNILILLEERRKWRKRKGEETREPARRDPPREDNNNTEEGKKTALPVEGRKGCPYTRRLTARVASTRGSRRKSGVNKREAVEGSQMSNHSGRKQMCGGRRAARGGKLSNFSPN